MLDSAWPMSTETKDAHESPNQPLTGVEDESPGIPADWLAEFEAAARRSLEVRMRYSFIHTYKPVMDDASYRSFDSMEDYRRWCEENLPSWLGYGRV
jgi:hypothetical protein